MELQSSVNKRAGYLIRSPMSDKPIALDAYETLAEAYAAVVDTKPHNAYYERPATLSLLPEVRGKRVLDAGCGPAFIQNGWLSAARRSLPLMPARRWSSWQSEGSVRRPTFA